MFYAAMLVDWDHLLDPPEKPTSKIASPEPDAQPIEDRPKRADCESGL